MKKVFLCLVSLLYLNAVEIDKETGLKISKGFEEVKTNCTVCHSANFIIQSKLGRDEWRETIRWMQETQGLWEFDAQTEDLILTYLAQNYPQENTSRRRPLLRKELLPPQE